VECYADSSRVSSTVEDQDSIVVSGDVDQQRDAVLANFARYNNSLGPRKTSRDCEGLGDRTLPSRRRYFVLGEVKRSLTSYLLRFGFIYRRAVEELPRRRWRARSRESTQASQTRIFLRWDRYYQMNV
jgi:hypothetical protein